MVPRSQPRPVEYFMLLNPRPEGANLGTYAGHPIPAAMVDEFGRRYAYAGVAPRLRDGRYDVDAVGKDEWLVDPGLLYRGSGET
jgi:hypothetical protein